MADLYKPRINNLIPQETFECKKTESRLQKYVHIDLNVAEWLNYSNIEKIIKYVL